MTSRLSSSAHWMSSNASNAGPSIASMIRSATSWTSSRRVASVSLAPASRLVKTSSPSSRNPAVIRIVRTRSRIEPSGTSRSCGARSARATLKPGGPCLAQDHLQQAALADARLAGEQQELAVALGGLGKAAIREVEEVVAADEEGTEERTDLAHRRGV